MGRLLPAGTGLAAYQKLDMVVEDAATMGTSEYDASSELAAAASEE